MLLDQYGGLKMMEQFVVPHIVLIVILFDKRFVMLDIAASVFAKEDEEKV